MKLAMVGVFTPWKLANIANQDFLPGEQVVDRPSTTAAHPGLGDRESLLEEMAAELSLAGWGRGWMGRQVLP